MRMRDSRIELGSTVAVAHTELSSSTAMLNGPNISTVFGRLLMRNQPNDILDRRALAVK